MLVSHYAHAVSNKETKAFKDLTTVSKLITLNPEKQIHNLNALGAFMIARAADRIYLLLNKPIGEVQRKFTNIGRMQDNADLVENALNFATYDFDMLSKKDDLAILDKLTGTTDAMNIDVIQGRQPYDIGDVQYATSILRKMASVPRANNVSGTNYLRGLLNREIQELNKNYITVINALNKLKSKTILIPNSIFDVLVEFLID